MKKIILCYSNNGYLNDLIYYTNSLKNDIIKLDINSYNINELNVNIKYENFIFIGIGFDCIFVYETVNIWNSFYCY